MIKVVWLLNETDYAYGEFVAPNTPYYDFFPFHQTTPIYWHIYGGHGLLKIGHSIYYNCPHIQYNVVSTVLCHSLRSPEGR